MICIFQFLSDCFICGLEGNLSDLDGLKGGPFVDSVFDWFNLWLTDNYALSQNKLGLNSASQTFC